MILYSWELSLAKATTSSTSCSGGRDGRVTVYSAVKFRAATGQRWNYVYQLIYISLNLRCTISGSVCKLVCVCARALCCSRLFVISWTVTLQAPLSMGFSWQECWNGLSFPAPRDLSDPGIKPASPALAGRVFTTVSPRKLL